MAMLDMLLQLSSLKLSKEIVFEAPLSYPEVST